ncbi:NACHT, LRR and PYD domains-containing protein 3-like [Sardina pilchardus]|uniref:NACHT, LRR and PYD domains-containing protein 3-like n=1 Tax=Sardina pilchardus TaxID=27697 RepID=UPI002E14567D
MNLPEEPTQHGSRGPLQQKRSDPPVASGVSIKSDQSMNHPVVFGGGDPTTDQPLQQNRPDLPLPSGVSMKSDQSMNHPVVFGGGDPTTDQPLQQNRPDFPVPSGVSMKSGQSMNHPVVFGGGDPTTDQHQRTNTQSHKSLLQKKFQCLSEGISRQENPTLLNEIYTELHITEGGSGEVSAEHEVRQIEMASKKSETYDTPIKCNDIFKPLNGQDKDIRTVLTQGVSGIGKTVSVQKFILDWAEGKANQDVHFIFPLPFRELNLMKEKKFSLVELLQNFFIDSKDFSIFTDEKFKLLFIFDGLDECRIPLDFHSNQRCCDVTEPTSVSVLLTNLIKRNLLPSALIWITSRPAAANQIPPECVDQVTEVRGFNNPQKEEYFRKRVSDENLAYRIVSYLESSRSLYIMCYIPVFCWIAATVLERMLCSTERGEIPKTLTEMYTHFLIIQTDIKQKYTYRGETDEEMIVKLGKLAFQQLEKGNLIFYEKDLGECGIDITEASVYSGVCTQIFREEAGLYQGKVFCFVHLSIQEHLAALYAHLTLITQKKNVLNPVSSRSKYTQVFRPVSDYLYDLHKSAVDLALQSKNGHLDLFLRFLLGLSLESNQNLLKDLLPLTASQSQSTEKSVQYIKQKIRKKPSSQKCINLFHCLNELNDQSLVEEIQRYLSPGGLDEAKLSPAQWSAVVFVLMTSEQELDEFDLQKYSRSEACLLRLMPVVKASRSAQLRCCNLTEKSCSSLASALSSGSSLRQLELSNNYLQDSGVKFLSAALGNPLCKLETLKLHYCNLTEKSCSSLASALSSGSSLRQLNLSKNELQDSGVTLLSAALENPLCKLETLQLRDCKLTEKSCSSLASVLSSGSSLRQLDLSYNNQLDSGVKHLSASLGSPLCKLEILVLCCCNLTENSCSSLASVFSSGSSLRQLDLSSNNQLDSGVKHLSATLGSPLCKLETLVLYRCNLTEYSCSFLASVLSSASSLRQLDLSTNKLQDSGVKYLSAALRNPLCKLETLKLWNCNLMNKSCSSLASVLSSGSSLRQLHLSDNELQDSGVKLLSAALQNPLSKLETLGLCWCKLTEKSCSSLASVLSSGSSLRQLELSSNYLQDSGVTLLSAALGNPLCKLETLQLCDCNLTEKSCSSLASALSSGSSLRQLNLSCNELQDSDVEPLSALQRNPQNNLQHLEWKSAGGSVSLMAAGKQFIVGGDRGTQSSSCSASFDSKAIHRVSQDYG